ncbi:Transcription factor bye1 [Paramarasmius palmivorus]|uniref:Transcription factor BYE1 n=1 Tax=Paramarasmius palmivorus TaxID=297713 RepID=A0AAW0E9U9_9AGAR
MSSRTTRARAQQIAASSVTASPKPATTKQKALPKEKPQSTARATGKGRATRSSVKEEDAVEVAEPQALPEDKENVKEELKDEEEATTTSRPYFYCTCRKGDDGTPMVFCVECKDWYHFACMGLDERTAEDIMLWEGPEAVEDTNGSRQVSAAAQKQTKKKRVSTPTTTDSPQTTHKIPTPEPEEPPSQDSDPGSEDDYTDEGVKVKAAGKRRLRAYASESESDDSVASDGNTTHRKRRLTKGKPSSASPGPISKSKRKAQAPSQLPPPKKARTNSDSSEDPTRKYCRGKLEDLFRDIFLRYPNVRRTEGDDGGGAGGGETGELTEDEKNLVIAQAKQFADDLETCVYELYAEPDKSGSPSAGPKYKDRFRTLQFNLSKPDRVVIHKRIASTQITPKELSVMSSTDLANEELRQSIKIAEQEALEHSILQKVTAPRAKITHKGLEDIEDVNGNNRERDRRQEDEERMERERLARLRAPRQRTMSTSVPPESPVIPSPVVPQSESWGAPPPVPAHALSDGQVAPYGDSGHPSRPPLFINTESEMTMPEPELNLADLINLDEEPTSAQDGPSGTPSTTNPSAPTQDLASSSVLTPPTTTPTGLSPFANVPQTQAQPGQASRSASFDLNSLWSKPSGDSPISETNPVERETSSPSVEDAGDTAMSEPQGADDGDFDMFLEEKEPLTPEASRAMFDSLPHVWNGKISMPLDSAIPQETPVVARQMGGRSIETESPLWKTLFPSDLLRIDGRVPVENSAKFLLQMRMNPTKELVAVAFSPSTEGETGFKILSEFLLNKGRHGLVFPWGQRPKEYHPGKELYIIPLLSSHPLPDYMELLDEMKLPKERTSDYLVGIWWLNRGKLAPPPSHSSTAPAPTQTQPTANIPTSFSLACSDCSTAATNHPCFNYPAIPNLTSQLAGLSAAVPVDQKALAAEIASLTPEQMDLMMRALASTMPAGTSSTLPVPCFQQPWAGSPPPGFSAFPPQYPPPGPDAYPAGQPHFEALITMITREVAVVAMEIVAGEVVVAVIEVGVDAIVLITGHVDRSILDGLVRSLIHLRTHLITKGDGRHSRFRVLGLSKVGLVQNRVSISLFLLLISIRILA